MKPQTQATYTNAQKAGIFLIVGLVFLAIVGWGAYLCFPSEVTSLFNKTKTAFFPPPPPDPRDKTFNAHSYMLDNGLQLVVIPNDRSPVVTHMVWYKVGAADEVAGQSGIAHFLEHLMFKGSGDLAPGEFSKTIRSLGGQDNAFTSQDYTAYYQSISSQHLQSVMEMEAQRMRGLNPPEADVLSERDVILEERRQRIDTNPAAQFQEHLRAVHFINHPYGTPVIGWLHEMQQLNWAQAKAFYDTHYGPNNAIVVITGDANPQAVYEAAQGIYGKLPRIDVPPREWPQSPPLPGTLTLENSDKSVLQPQITLLFSVPSAVQDKEASLALSILSDTMGGGASSRLYRQIVVQQKLASAISLSYDPDTRSTASLSISAYPAPGVEPDALKQAILQSLNSLARDGITAQELQTSINKAQDAAVFARDSLEGPAMIIGQALATGQSLEDVEYWPYDIAAVTQAAVLDVARRYLWPDHDGSTQTHMTYGVLMPQDQITEGTDQ